MFIEKRYQEDTELGSRVIIPTKEMLKLKEILKRNNHKEVKYQLSTIDIELKKAKNFYREKFTLNKVKYLPKLSKSKELFLDIMELLNYQYYLEEYDALKEIDPFSLPIVLGDSAFLKSRHFMNSYLAENYWPIIHEIVINKKITADSATDIIHEIAHTQECVNPFETDYHNSEIIPIFLETLYKIESGLFTFEEIYNYRFMDMTNHIEELETYNEGKIPYVRTSKLFDAYAYSRYLTGSLIAMDLINRYCNYYDSSKKKRLLDEIQKVFDKKQTVEKLLSKLNLNEEVSAINLVKKLRKDFYAKRKLY